MEEAWANWLSQWTPAALGKFIWQVGIWGVLALGLVITCIRHGWPWQQKK